MKIVFADAFYFVARLNRHDQYRERVLNFMERFEGELVTSDWVLMEVADALGGSHVRANIREYVQALCNASNCTVIAANREAFDRALTLYHRHSDKEWSLTDCTSFVIMREMGITEAL